MTMRILHVIDSLVPRAGTAAVVLPGLIAASRAKGIDARVLTDELPADPSFLEIREANVVVHHSQSASIRDLMAGSDLVHVHGWGSELSLSAARIARRVRTSYFVSPLGGCTRSALAERPWKGRVRHRWVERNALRGASRVFAANEFERQELDHFGLSEQTSILSYGLTIKDYERNDSATDLPAAPQGRIVLILSTLHPRGGCVSALKAFAEAGREADGWFVVVAGEGSGEWHQMLAAAIRRKGGDERLMLTAAETPDTQRAWLQRASLLLAPSQSLGCPVSILQAVASGVPALAFRRCVPDGLAKWIRTWEPGPGKLKEALRTTLTMDESELAEAAAKGKNELGALFGWSILVESYVREYQRECVTS